MSLHPMYASRRVAASGVDEPSVSGASELSAATVVTRVNINVGRVGGACLICGRLDRAESSTAPRRAVTARRRRRRFLVRPSLLGCCSCSRLPCPLS